MVILKDDFMKTFNFENKSAGTIFLIKRQVESLLHEQSRFSVVISGGFGTYRICELLTSGESRRIVSPESPLPVNES